MYYLYKKIFLIDSTLFAYKSYYVINYKKRIKNFYKSFYIFIKMIYLRYIKIFPNYIIFIFDNKIKNNYRKKIFSNYKSNRKKCSKNFLLYLNYIKNKLNNLNINIISIPNIESDDVINNIIIKLNKLYKYINIYILSYDKDFIQLISKNVYLYSHINRIINIKNIYKYYGLYPYLLKDFLVLCGDKSDNIPGIKGIGKKTALKLLHNIGDIYSIYNNLNKLLYIGINKNIIQNLKNNFNNIRI